MSQGRSVISTLMMLWMLLILGVLGYRQFTQEPRPVKAKPSKNQIIWLR